MSLHRLNLFTIAAGEPFLDRLARGLTDLYGPEGLPGIDVALPNRRAVRGLMEAFLRLDEGRVLMLPSIRAIGDVDEDELVLDPGPDLENADLPAAISPIERQLILTRLILRRETDGTGPAMAMLLADALGRLIDEVTIQERSFDDLAGLVPARFAEHWQKVLEFLTLVTRAWPAILAERGVIDAADRRGRLLRALTARLEARPPARPFIIAGSTGSIPASAALMAATARLENGMVILPGLDLLIDDEAYAELEPGHPQWGMRQTLIRMGATRDDVRNFGPANPPSARAVLLSEAMRPAAVTDSWYKAISRLTPIVDDALDGLTILEAPSEVDEAAAIALALREVLETPGRTAALVTPDRSIARRVAAELARWHIQVDDSAGRPLSKLPVGIFMSQVMDAAIDAAPTAVLALLKHPLCSMGEDRSSLDDAVTALEIGALRGMRPPPGFDALVGHAATPFAAAVASNLRDRLQPLLALSRSTAALGQWIDAHVAAAESLASTKTGSGADLIWRGEAGEALMQLLASARAVDVLEPMSAADYAALTAQLMDQTPVRPHRSTHARISILGPIEARLQRADVMILGGLNEDTWPQASAIDPWFSRPMRHDFGLDPPERRLGQSAHDFVMAASGPRVILSRAIKLGTAPSVPSRWLLRLQTLITGLKRSLPTPGPDHDYVRFAAVLDRPKTVRPIPPPEPRPPASARPRRLSVTQVETLIRDPYAIYARHILKLKPLEPIDRPADAALRGSLIHRMLELFARNLPHADLRAAFLAVARDLTGDVLRRPALAALWWPRIERVADWVAETWPRMEASADIVGIECKGAISFDAPGGPFTLSAKADRIDRHSDGLVIVDYKSGTPPTAAQIRSGFAAQFPLEGAIALAGGFEGIDPQTVKGFDVVQVSGGAEPAKWIHLDVDAEAVSREHFAAFKALIARYDEETMPYLSRPRVQYLARYSDYDHLARVREWSAAGQDAGEE